MNVKLEGITKKFGEQPVIDNLNLSIESGEFLALLGPSGCGKSTILMMLAGLYSPTSGKIYFGDTVVNNLEPKKRNIGMVFQSYALYPHMTVFENIAFPLKQQGTPKEERVKRVEEVTKLVRLQDYLYRKPSQLSGGQQQRVALARALVKKPDLLLLDEPMSNLDTRLKIDMRNEIRYLQKQLNITTILVTHDQEEAMVMADRIAVLDAGKIQQLDTPSELFHNPKNLFVARFIGNPPMNFLKGTVAIEAEKQVIIGDGWRYAVVKNLPKSCLGKKVKIGIRPHLLFVSEKKEDAFPATLFVVERLGKECVVKAKIGKEIVSFFLENEEAERLEKEFYLYLDPKGVHIFADTGENLTLSVSLQTTKASIA